MYLKSSIKETFHRAVRVCYRDLIKFGVIIKDLSEEVAFELTPEG